MPGTVEKLIRGKVNDGLMKIAAFNRSRLPEPDRPHPFLSGIHAPLAVVYGIEPFIILKDICGASDRETEAVVRWMMGALVGQALREAPDGAKPQRNTARTRASTRRGPR